MANYFLGDAASDGHTPWANSRKLSRANRGRGELLARVLRDAGSGSAAAAGREMT